MTTNIRVEAENYYLKFVLLSLTITQRPLMLVEQVILMLKVVALSRAGRANTYGANHTSYYC